VIDWILQNKAWLFSGLLVAVPIAIVGWILAKRSVVQKQKAGNNSVNIQGMGNTTVSGLGDRSESTYE
jgi:hypothetical protein